MLFLALIMDLNSPHFLSIFACGIALWDPRNCKRDERDGVLANLEGELFASMPSIHLKKNLNITLAHTRIYYSGRMWRWIGGSRSMARRRLTSTINERFDLRSVPPKIYLPWCLTRRPRCDLRAIKKVSSISTFEVAPFFKL